MGDTLQSNQSLGVGGQLVSSDGGHRLVFQSDGNVVVYNAQNKATWATNTVNTETETSTTLSMQTDGNLVLYGELWVNPPVSHPPHPPIPPRPPIREQIVRFASNTSGQPGGYLVMQSDGNLVIYRPEIVAIWNTHTTGK